MREIKLTQDKVTLVDDKDYNRLMKMGSWSALAIRPDYWVATTRHNGGRVSIHRIILDAPDHLQVDHINHDTLDNRRCNLRLCTRSQQQANRVKRLGASSKYKGVYWHKWGKQWMASIRVNGKLIYLGLFKDEEDGARAYNVAAHKHFGEFALLNEI